MKTLLNVGHNTGDYVVETREAAALIEPWVQRESALYESRSGPSRDPGMGPLTYLAEEVARRRRTTWEAVYRRLWAIRSGETNAANADLIENICITIGNEGDFAELPVFPAGKKAAREMVDVWCEDWSEMERASFASTLLHFTQGYFSVDRVEDSDVYALLAACAVTSVAA